MAKVVRFHQLGGPELLRLEEITFEDPAPGELRLKVVPSPQRSFQKRRYATSRNPLNGAPILAAPFKTSMLSRTVSERVVQDLAVDRSDTRRHAPGVAGSDGDPGAGLERVHCERPASAQQQLHAGWNGQ
jgi:hypothetical protein